VNGIIYKIKAAFRNDPPFLLKAGGDLTFERESRRGGVRGLSYSIQPDRYIKCAVRDLSR